MSMQETRGDTPDTPDPDDTAGQLEHPGVIIGEEREALENEETEVFGFWTFMMSDAIIFTLLFATFGVMRGGTAGGPGPADLFELHLTAMQTAALLASSITFGFASLQMQKDSARGASAWLAVTFVFGACFLGLELYEFLDVFEKGGVPQRSGFLSAWFTLLATHGLHVTFGMGWILIMFIQLAVFGTEPRVEQRMVKLGIFWHFLDLIWVAIFSVVYLGSLV